MHDTERTANPLGAAALAVTGGVLGAVSRGVGVSTSAAAALVVLRASPGRSVTEPGRRIGLGQPAAARTVGSMQTTGLVKRRAGAGREARVTPSPAGREATSRLPHTRMQPLRDLVAVLGPDEQSIPADLPAALPAQLHTEVGSSELLCRLRDRHSGTTNAACPVGQAERDRNG